MENLKFVLLILFLLMSAPELKSSPMGRDFGIGIMVGEPTALTAKIWTQKSTAIAISLGNSYLGNFRVGLDYVWHFNAFNSPVVSLYAGPGVAFGIGESGGWVYKNKDKYWYKENDEIAVGVRGLLGLNIIPRNSPIEFFGEIGLMFGLVPSTHTNAEGAIGFRYYF